MYRSSPLAGVALALAASMAVPAPSAAQDHVDYWAVTGVASNDVLHLRDVPSADSKSLARIPPTAHGLKNFGCRRTQLSMDEWMNMSKQQRRFAQTRWCRVQYRGKQGWVAGRYLKKDRAPAKK